MKSQLNYKYLWMHGDEKLWMGASATMDTPLHHKVFKVTPVSPDCSGGWVLLQPGDSLSYVKMVPPAASVEMYIQDSWVVNLGTDRKETALNDTQYHFLVEDEGFVLNRGATAFLNVMTENEYTVRGHSSGWNRDRPAKREYGATLMLQYVNETEVLASLGKEAAEEKEAKEADEQMVKLIASFPRSAEKRVISFGLYGAKPKYTQGAIRNAELLPVYFPGWVCRFYVTSDVPTAVVDRLRQLGSEIEPIPSGMGYSSGMFWRFLVAADDTVDRFIIRDSDSRLNARDRIAVEEWINSKYPIHIQRDHVNHCIVMNGGMWGGVKGAIPDMKAKVMNWYSRDEYMADLHFLEQEIWPHVQK